MTFEIAAGTNGDVRGAGEIQSADVFDCGADGLFERIDFFRGDDKSFAVEDAGFVGLDEVEFGFADLIIERSVELRQQIIKN